jgi:hypothetical protein
MKIKRELRKLFKEAGMLGSETYGDKSIWFG